MPFRQFPRAVYPDSSPSYRQPLVLRFHAQHDLLAGVGDLHLLELDWLEQVFQKPFEAVRKLHYFHPPSERPFKVREGRTVFSYRLSQITRFYHENGGIFVEQDVERLHARKPFEQREQLNLVARYFQCLETPARSFLARAQLENVGIAYVHHAQCAYGKRLSASRAQFHAVAVKIHDRDFRRQRVLLDFFRRRAVSGDYDRLGSPYERQVQSFLQSDFHLSRVYGKADRL